MELRQHYDQALSERGNVNPEDILGSALALANSYNVEFRLGYSLFRFAMLPCKIALALILSSAVFDLQDLYFFKKEVAVGKIWEGFPLKNVIACQSKSQNGWNYPNGLDQIFASVTRIDWRTVPCFGSELENNSWISDRYIPAPIFEFLNAPLPFRGAQPESFKSLWGDTFFTIGQVLATCDNNRLCNPGESFVLVTARYDKNYNSGDGSHGRNDFSKALAILFDSRGDVVRQEVTDRHNFGPETWEGFIFHALLSFFSLVGGFSVWIFYELCYGIRPLMRRSLI
jgi:hypothetical protein